MSLPSLCFVLMPFNKKPDGNGGIVDFDNVYNEGIRPAIADAGLEPIRADEEATAGIIHKPMFERLVLCEYAVADLTTANANVFYELGVRHAVRSWSTPLIFAEGGRLPFDVNLLRALPYKLTSSGTLADAASLRKSLGEQLKRAVAEHKKTPTIDSPVFQLMEGYPDVDPTHTDVFREQVEYSRMAKDKLAVARRGELDAVRHVEADLGDLSRLESGVLVDLFLSYRACKAWEDMIRLAESMPRILASTILIQEQYALALNRANRGDAAEAVLLELLKQRGPSSETLGILGRVYKDRWDAQVRAGEGLLSTSGSLDKAIDAYLRGFEADWRDSYPGINTVTLMELQSPPDPRRLSLMPVVRYAVERKMAGGSPDYWDHATLCELCVLGMDEAGATKAARAALAAFQKETRKPETTARNLGLIREARAARGEVVPWADAIENELAKHGKR